MAGLLGSVIILGIWMNLVNCSEGRCGDGFCGGDPRQIISTAAHQRLAKAKPGSITTSRVHPLWLP